jgi:hypothetical protein
MAMTAQELDNLIHILRTHTPFGRLSIKELRDVFARLLSEGYEITKKQS